MRITNVSLVRLRVMVQSTSMPTKERILNAAIDLFAEKGFGNVSVRDIAQKVGIRASSLYKHYECKEDILNSIFDHFKEKILQTRLPEQDLNTLLKSMTPEQYLNASFEQFKQVMWTPINVKISRIITLEQQRNHSVRTFFVREFMEKPKQMLRHVLDVMIQNGTIGPLDTEVAAEEYHAYIISLYYEQNFLREHPSLDEIEMKMKQHNAFFARNVLQERWMES